MQRFVLSTLTTATLAISATVSSTTTTYAAPDFDKLREQNRDIHVMATKVDFDEIRRASRENGAVDFDKLREQNRDIHVTATKVDFDEIRRASRENGAVDFDKLH